MKTKLSVVIASFLTTSLFVATPVYAAKDPVLCAQKTKELAKLSNKIVEIENELKQALDALEAAAVAKQPTKALLDKVSSLEQKNAALHISMQKLIKTVETACAD